MEFNHSFLGIILLRRNRDVVEVDKMVIQRTVLFMLFMLFMGSWLEVDRNVKFFFRGQNLSGLENVITVLREGSRI